MTRIRFDGRRQQSPSQPVHRAPVYVDQGTSVGNHWTADGRLAGVIDPDIQSSTQDLVDRWLPVPEVAEQLGVDVTRVRQLLRERQLLAVRRGDDGVLQIPAAFIRDGKVLKGLPGTLTLLADSGFDDDAALRWLFSTDDSLPGTPVQALMENRGTEVRRRAQALAL
jgi:Rv2175c C-terminal domain of unknown function